MGDFDEFLATSIFAVFVAIVALGSGSDQSRRLLTQLEKDYAANRRIPWRSVRPILRSTSSADEKLTAIGDLIGTVELEPDLYPFFEQADATLSKLQRWYRVRYYGLVSYVLLLLALMILGWWLSEDFSVTIGSTCLGRKQFIIATALLPVVSFLYLFLRIGFLESRFSDFYSSVEAKL